MGIYSRTWVRNTVYLIAIVPTMYLYAAFFFAMKFLEKYRREVRDDGRFKKLWKMTLIPVGGIFLLLDGAYDLTFGSMLFRKLSEWGVRDKTLTARIKMYIKDYEVMSKDPTQYDQDVVDRYELAIKFRDIIKKIDPNHF